MDKLIQVLDAPDSFEDMSKVLMSRETVRQAKNVLESQEIEINPRLFLAGWMISRFPDTLETSYDVIVKERADTLVASCKRGEKLRVPLSSFVHVFDAWKANDFEKLKLEIRETRERLSSLTFSDPENQKTVDEMVACLDRQADKLGM